MRPALPSLTGLRFAAAFAVFGLHISGSTMWPDGPVRTILAWLFGSGTCGVSFFFVLSGFVLTWSARPDDTPGAFWRRRVAKIYPSHVFMWAFVLLWILAGAYRVTAGAALANLFLIQAWWPDQSIALSVNVVTWSLSCEAFFYLLFPALLRLIGRIRGDRLLLVAAALAAAVIAAPVAVGPRPDAIYFCYFFPPVRLLEFVLGMVLARLVVEDRWIGIRAPLAGTLSVVAVLIAAHAPGQLRYAAVTILPFALLIPAMARVDLTGAPSRWRSPPAVLLGQASFGFYLVHQFVIRAVVTAANVEELPLAMASGLALLTLGLSLAGGYALYRWVERPFQRRFRRARRPSIGDLQPNVNA